MRTSVKNLKRLHKYLRKKQKYTRKKQRDKFLSRYGFAYAGREAMKGLDNLAAKLIN